MLFRSQGSGGNFYYAASATKSALYEQNTGQHIFYTAGTGTAGNAISFTQAMTLDNGGNLLVGNTSVISFGTGYTNINAIGSSGGAIAVGQSSNYGFFGVNGAFGYLGTVQALPLIFATNNTERARIDASGKIGRAHV